MLTTTLNTETLIMHYEGLHDGDLSRIGAQPKMCPAGIWTEGYGHAMTDPLTQRFLKGTAAKARAYELCPGMTEDAASILLEQDLSRFVAIVNNALRVNLNFEQKGALVSFSFNLGQDSLLSSTLLKRINMLDFAGAGDEFLRWDWAKVDGVAKQLPGLTARRKSERELFLTGTLKFYN